jgi:hypothetical protein
MVRQTDNPVVASGDLGGREVTLSGAVSWGSLGLRFGTSLPVDLPATPARDGMVD